MSMTRLEPDQTNAYGTLACLQVVHVVLQHCALPHPFESYCRSLNKAGLQKANAVKHAGELFDFSHILSRQQGANRLTGAS